MKRNLHHRTARCRRRYRHPIPAIRAREGTSLGRSPGVSSVEAMTADFVIVQGLNGVAYGLLLFLLAAGLSLIFGMMDVVNLAHGSFFMLGAGIRYLSSGRTH